MGKRKTPSSEDKSALPSKRDLEESAYFAAELGADVPEIDLHGLRYQDAESSFAVFLEQCIARRESSARVIHGNGEGILRTMVEKRLESLKKSGDVYGYRNGSLAHQIGACKVILFNKPVFHG